MARIRSNETSIEVKLRLALWHAGVRYRKNVKSLPGKPDIVLGKYKIAVFCDSSFFHGRDFETKKKPGTNRDYWDQKVKRNMERDAEINAQLESMGWKVLRFWDKEILKDTEGCVRRIKAAIEGPMGMDEARRKAEDDEARKEAE